MPHPITMGTITGQVRRRGKSVTVRQTADVANSAVTNADVTDLHCHLAANEEVLIEGWIRHVAAATTTGLSLGFTDPSGCETSFLWWGPATTAAGQVKGSVADDTVAAQAGTISTTAPQLSRFSAWVRNGATAGPWQLRFASEVGASAVTIKADSFMTVRGADEV